ncbi:MAG: hypothetical protein JSU57_05110 [Candidatus Heimdallarchaeota archaeon]|nr:MAG: hypothetical protein JSU57_05110 [Candidatus Heimdallarchaeota archaeon]
MNPDEEFSLDGIAELDIQVKLYQLGVESFSPYAGSGKVDMVIRSENGDLVHYADIKVCTGLHKGANIVWELDIGFFMNSDSFIILTIRLPEEDETFQNHHFVLESKEFLRIAKKHRLRTRNDKWIVGLPFSDLQILNKQSKSKLSKSLTRSLKNYFDNWDCLLEWQSNR